MIASVIRSRLLFLLLILLLIYISVAQGQRLLAHLAGVAYRPDYQALQGERIIAYRNAVLRHDLPASIDLLFAGTSRTMADYDASRVMRGLSRGPACPQTPLALNAGNIANHYDAFLRWYRQSQSHIRIMVLEFSPHVLLRHHGPDVLASSAPVGLFQRYRRGVEDFERRFSAYVLYGIGFGDPLRLNIPVHAVARALRSGNPAGAYSLMRAVNGYGQVLQADGQVYYRNYFFAPWQSRLARPLMSELGTYAGRNLRHDPDPVAWSSMQAIIRLAARRGTRLVFVRPAVSDGMYRLENRMQGPLIARFTSYLRQQRLPYIDLNPNEYASTDDSHIDWFDTPALADRLAGSLATVLGKRVMACP